MPYFERISDMSYETISRTIRGEVDIIFHLPRAV